jgi:hypothetical protein
VELLMIYRLFSSYWENIQAYFESNKSFSNIQPTFMNYW